MRACVGIDVELAVVAQPHDEGIRHYLIRGKVQIRCIGLRRPERVERDPVETG